MKRIENRYESLEKLIIGTLIEKKAKKKEKKPLPDQSSVCWLVRAFSLL